MGGEDDIHRRLLRGPHERPCGHRTASSHCPPQGSGPRRRLATTLITAGNAAGENRAWWSILRSSNSEPPMSLVGHLQVLPRRSIAVRFTSESSRNSDKVALTLSANNGLTVVPSSALNEGQTSSASTWRAAGAQQ